MARRLLLLAELEVLAPLDLELLLGLARLALEPQHDLFGRLRLLVEDGLRLAAEAHLLRVVPSLALREVTGLAGLVLRHLVDLVLAAFLVLAVGLAFFRDVDHRARPPSRASPAAAATR